MRKDLEALPHLALAAHFPPVSQGMKFLPGVPRPPAHHSLSSHLKARMSADRSSYLREKKGFAKCFCRFLGDGEREGDPCSPHGRKEWFLFNCRMQDRCPTLLSRLETKQGQTKMCQSRTAGTLPPRPSPL